MHFIVHRNERILSQTETTKLFNNMAWREKRMGIKQVEEKWKEEMMSRRLKGFERGKPAYICCAHLVAYGEKQKVINK